MLAILATCRGVYMFIEQPASSTMKWFPDLVQTGKLVNKHLGNIWREQFLSIAQIFDLASYNNGMAQKKSPPGLIDASKKNITMGIIFIED